MAKCPRCGEPMTGGICDNCGFPMCHFKKIIYEIDVEVQLLLEIVASIEISRKCN